MLHLAFNHVFSFELREAILKNDNVKKSSGVKGLMKDLNPLTVDYIHFSNLYYQIVDYHFVKSE